ncbi:MAG: hypothetical protein CMH27_07460 [Micavibrio sp.]|nr:hypothetical protein [Micavibrio sp.]|tara:strand:+ start:1500 stop:2327 length:828 start_codon:yes stop_codon:yes gene_type:complete
MSKSVDERIKEHLKESILVTPKADKSKRPIVTEYNANAKQDAASNRYNNELDQQRPPPVANGQTYSGLGISEMRNADLENFYCDNYNGSSVFKKIGIISNFIPSSIPMLYGDRRKLHWEGFPLHKHKAIAIAYDPDIKKFRYQEAQGLVRVYNKGGPYNVDGCSGFTPPSIKVRNKKPLLEKLTTTKKADDWVTIPNSEKLFNSPDELKEQFLDDIAKGIEYHIKQTPWRLTKIFGALTIASSLIYSCATNAATHPANDQAPITPSEISVSFEPK